MRRGIKNLTAVIRRAGGIVTAGLVITVVFFPLFSSAAWARSLISIDHRSLMEPPAFSTRAIDKQAGAPQLFNQGLLSVTFDDGWESVYKDAYPLFQKYGIQTTQYIISGVFDDKDYMSYAQVEDMSLSGHEIACHTSTHPDLTTLDNQKLYKELHDCHTMFNRNGIPATDFASPYGHTDARTLQQIKTVYRSHRNTNGDIRQENGVSDADVNTRGNFDRYNLIGITVRQDTSLDELKAVIDYANSHNAWVILTYHQIDDDNSPFGLDNSKLEAQLKYISSSNIRIVTVGDVMATPAAMESEDVRR